MYFKDSSCISLSVILPTIVLKCFGCKNIDHSRCLHLAFNLNTHIKTDL